MSKRVHVLYHSKSWALLVESGWFTLYTFDNPCDGCTIAVMIKGGE